MKPRNGGAEDNSTALATWSRKDRAMLRPTCTIVLVAQLFAMGAWAGPAEDTALREAARNLDIIGVKAALERGANPNAASSDPRPATPLNAVSLGIVVGGSESHPKARFPVHPGGILA
jgi:hypothetical protein